MLVQAIGGVRSHAPLRSRKRGPGRHSDSLADNRLTVERPLWRSCRCQRSAWREVGSGRAQDARNCSREANRFLTAVTYAARCDLGILTLGTLTDFRL
jgi:hypothetical protein